MYTQIHMPGIAANTEIMILPRFMLNFVLRNRSQSVNHCIIDKNPVLYTTGCCKAQLPLLAFVVKLSCEVFFLSRGSEEITVVFWKVGWLLSEEKFLDKRLPVQC